MRRFAVLLIVTAAACDPVAPTPAGSNETEALVRSGAPLPLSPAHVLPRTDARAATAESRLSPAVKPALVGAVLASPRIVMVNWGTTVDAKFVRNAASFYQDIATDGYLTQLGEYGVGNGSFVGAYTITPKNTSTTLDQNAIDNELNAQINAGALPANVNNSSLYMIHLPAGFTLEDGSEAVQCAYHASYSVGSSTVAWAAIGDYNPGSTCTGGYVYTRLGELNDRFFATSHEVIEAVVDPYGGNVEVGDGCDDGSKNGGSAWTSVPGATHPWFVQKPWLASTSTCGGQTLPTPATGSAVESAGPLVGRTPNNLDFFEARADGSVWTSYWFSGQPVGSWPSFQLPGSAVGVKPHSPIAAVSRYGDHLDIFYIGATGAIWWQFWSSGTGWSSAQKITADGATVVGGGLAAVARSANNLDVFFYGSASHGIDTLWWAPGVDTSKPWPTYSIADSANAVQNGAAIAAVARRTDALDVFWIGTWGFVGVSSWNATDNKFKSTGIGSALALSLDSGLAATARTWNIVDVFYVNQQGLLASANSVDEQLGSWTVTSPLVTPPGTAQYGVVPSHVAAATRAPDNIDVFYVDQAGQVATAWFQTGNAWSTAQMCSPSMNVTSTPGNAITALSRSGGLDVVETNALGGTDWNRWWVAPACGGWDSSQIVADAFGVALGQSSTSLPANDTESISVTTTVGSCSPVVLSVSSAAAGVNASLSQTSVASSGTSWLYLGVALGTVPAVGTVTVTGTCGGVTSSATLEIMTTACVPVTSCSADACGNPSNGCGGTLSCGGCPTGETCSSNTCVTKSPTCHTPAQCCIQSGGSWVGNHCI